LKNRSRLSPVRIGGLILVLAAGIGFLTVADDLRHKGELFGVGSILAAGLVLLAIPVRSR
jgi:hypothetical protein